MEVDITAIPPGQKITVEWRGKPVWIMRRTPEQLASLKKPSLMWLTPNQSALRIPFPNTPKTNTAPSSQMSLSVLAFVPIWDALPVKS